MRAGALKDRVEIQTKKTVTRDGIGGESESWSTSPQVFRNCSIEPLNGREFFAAQGESSEITVRIRFRYESGLLSVTKRLVDHRRSPAMTYDIESVINHGNENRELICMCKVRNG